MQFVVGSTGGLGHGVVDTTEGGTTAPNAILVGDGECTGRQTIDHIPEVSLGCRGGAADRGRTARTRHLAKHTQHVDLQQGRRGEVDVNVGAQVAAYILVLRGIAVGGIWRLDESLVGEDVQHGEIAELLTTAAELHVDFVGSAALAEGLVHPVDVGVLVGILSALEGSQLFSRVAGTGSLVGIGLVDGTGKGGAIDKLRTVALEVEQVVVADTDVLRVILTTLGGDQDSTVGALVAIECHGGSVLQDADVVDLLRADKAHVALDTVHQDEGRTGAQALQTTDVECRVLFEVGSRSLQGDQSVALAEDGVTDILGRTLIDIFIGNDRHGSGRLGTGEVLVGSHLNDLVHKADACAVLLCCCRQTQACKQRQHEYISILHNFHFLPFYFFPLKVTIPGFGQVHNPC